TFERTTMEFSGLLGQAERPANQYSRYVYTIRWPYVVRGLDLPIPSFPLLYLGPDCNRLYPPIADSTSSVPLISLSLSLPRTLHISSGALSRSNTASFVLREDLFPAHHSLSFAP